MLSEIKLIKLEDQIQEEKKTVDFDTREFTIEILVKKYLDEIESEQNELFVPEYQREFVWDDIRQSRLIESITLGLPIPIIFVAENEAGRLEIVDGSQRIRTLSAYLSDLLLIDGLEKLTEMNGTKFSDLPVSRQRKIKNTPIRMIVLSEAATEQVKNDLFERINRGSDILRNMEKRKGIYRGPFTKFIYDECAKNEKLVKNSPLAKTVDNRQELEELILRFFALIEAYPNFSTHKRGIGSMLDDYMDKTNEIFDEILRVKLIDSYQKMLNFVDSSFKHGFSKRRDQPVSRVYFEALSVGVHLALKERPDLKVEKVDTGIWLADSYFRNLIAGKYKTHTPEKMRQRIDYVKKKLLELSDK